MQLAEVKSRFNKIKEYGKRLDNQIKEAQEKALKLAKEGHRDRALLAIKHKKYLEKNRQKANGVELTLTETITGIESAQMDVNVYEAMKVGDQCLKELKAQVSADKFEELLDSHKEHVAQ